MATATPGRRSTRANPVREVNDSPESVRRSSPLTPLPPRFSAKPPSSKGMTIAPILSTNDKAGTVSSKQPAPQKPPAVKLARGKGSSAPTGTAGIKGMGRASQRQESGLSPRPRKSPRQGVSGTSAPFPASRSSTLELEPVKVSTRPTKKAVYINMTDRDTGKFMHPGPSPSDND